MTRVSWAGKEKLHYHTTFGIIGIFHPPRAYGFVLFEDQDMSECVGSLQDVQYCTPLVMLGRISG